jgi:hypothetical protein
VFVALYLVLQKFSGTISGRGVKLEPSTLLDDAQYDVSALQSQGCPLMLYDAGTMAIAVQAFRSLSVSQKPDSMIPTLRSFNVGQDVLANEARFLAIENDVVSLDSRLSTVEASFTSDGGIALPLINDTGAASVKGTVVEASGSVEGGFDVVSSNGVDAIGVVFEDGIADGQPCLVTIQGIALTLLEDSTASTLDYWVKVSDTQAGRADATNPTPPGGTITALEDHFSEIGHCMSAETAGTDVLAKVFVHFN